MVCSMRPRFAETYPEDPDLDAMLESFDAGNYRAVRDGAARLDVEGKPEAVREAARDLVSRTGPDAVQKALLGIALVVILILSGYWLTHQPAHPSVRMAPPKPEVIK